MRNKTQYIKLAIVSSFIKLLEARRFEKVTVKDIVEDCGVTRNTFYNYFEDTYDIVDYLLQEQMRKMVQPPGELTLYSMLSELTELAYSNRKIIYHLYHSPKQPELLRCFDKGMELMVRHLVDRAIGEKTVEDSDRVLIVDVMRHAANGMLQQWVESGMEESMEGKIHRLELLFERTVPYAISRAEQLCREENGAQNSDKLKM